MNYKKFVSFFLLLSITTTFLLSCDKADKNNITKENENVVTETTEWTFDKLVQESDCCLIIGVIQDEKENWNSKVVDGEYYSTFKLSKPQYIPQFFSFPDEITIIQKESAFLEKRKIGENVRFYIVFLNEMDIDNTYYIAGNTYGVIEIGNSYDLVPLEKSLESEINKKFPIDESQDQFNVFRKWLIDEYYKDFEYTTVHYDNITF